MRIFLLGMPGSGKSTIGRYLSAHSYKPVLDLDKIIEADKGMTISEIFAKEGEKRFREIERDCLRQVIEMNENAIISTGGGTPCFFDNMEHMKANGKTVYIDVPLATLIDRTSSSSKRPLLQGDTSNKIQELLKQRESFYNQADEIFTTDGKESPEVAKIIAMRLFNL